MIVEINPELFTGKISSFPEMYQLGMAAILIIHKGHLCLNSCGSTVVLGEILEKTGRKGTICEEVKG